MERLPDDEMVNIYIIRQDYAKALNAYEADPTYDHTADLAEVTERRARAMRSLARDDGASVRQLSAMFRCGKTHVREALAAEEE
jgi:hypothetical protein